MNRVAKILDTEYSLGQDLTLYLLAYNYTVSAPDYCEELAFYKGENVDIGVVYAPIEKHMNRSIEDVYSLNKEQKGILKAVSNYVKVGGGGSYSGACINFDINAKANITVYYENTGSNSRYAALFDNAGGKISAETAATSSSGIVSYTFNNVNTGNYSVGSASSGLNIYLIVVEYI